VHRNPPHQRTPRPHFRIASTILHLPPKQGQADATLQQYLNECTFATTCAMHRRCLCTPVLASRPTPAVDETALSQHPWLDAHALGRSHWRF
jgi:hypothetical protein